MDHFIRRNSGFLTKERRKAGGSRAENVAKVRGVLLEGSMDMATLEWLGRAVVVDHVTFVLTLSREEQAAEFVHLLRADTDCLFADNPGNAFQQRGCSQRAIISPVVQLIREQSSRVEVFKRSCLVFAPDGIKGVKNLLETGVFIPNLQENSHNSESIVVFNSFIEAGVFGVPVHQMELSRILGSSHGMLRAPVVSRSPVEMKLLESVDA